MPADKTPVTVSHKGDVAFVAIDNPPVNATSTAVRAGLADAVATVQGARLAVLMCAGRTFVAGGDMAEFDSPAREPYLSDVVRMIEDSATPFLAVLHGTVLGGGLEIAMGCAWRIADETTRFGLPEVNVGLIPGAGGSQRAPRLIGMKAAIDMACHGKLLDAPAMKALGGVDALFSGDAETAVGAFTDALPPRPEPVRNRPVLPLADDVLAAERAAIEKRARGQKSPLLNLSALQWALGPFEEGQRKERAEHLELRQSAESKALRHAFFAERAVMRPKAMAASKARVLDKIVIVGGGLMGSGIAMACLTAGLSVTLLEQDETAATTARDRIAGLIDGAAARGRFSAAEAGTHLARLTVACDYAAARGADLALEAVFEDLEVKQAVFRRLAEIVDDDTCLATNTSYLDPRRIFDGIHNPARAIGLHFFSPAHIMKLLEIIRLPETTPDVLATTFELGKRLKKVPVLSGICDGFIGNRMLSQYRRAAEYMLADGALPQDIDAAMRASGFPMGPFELQDLTGLQIAYANRQRQAKDRDPAERYVTIADQLCDMGRLGQRTGRGWYDYEDGARKPVISPEVERVILDYAAASGIQRRAFSAQEISDRLLAVLANEGALIVEQGIADTDDAIDMVQLHGYAFPRWLGGPMHRADRLGWYHIARVMDHVATESPGSWVLSARAMGGKGNPVR